MNCTTTKCEKTATRIMAWPMLAGKALFVAPYCDTHAEDVAKSQGAIPATGPALSKDAREIDGIR